MKLLNSRGQLEYGKLAKALGIPDRTFRLWRNPDSKHFKADLVKELNNAHDELLEGIQSGKIKQTLIKRAMPYIQIKRFKEPRIVGPKMPEMRDMDNKALILCAKNLGLKVDKTMTKGILKTKIAEEVKRQTKEVMVTVRQEEERILGDVAAARIVLANIGPKDKRWIEKQEVSTEGMTLADIAAIMSGRREMGNIEK